MNTEEFTGFATNFPNLQSEMSRNSTTNMAVNTISDQILIFVSPFICVVFLFRKFYGGSERTSTVSRVARSEDVTLQTKMQGNVCFNHTIHKILQRHVC